MNSHVSIKILPVKATRTLASALGVSDTDSLPVPCYFAQWVVAPIASVKIYLERITDVKDVAKVKIENGNPFEISMEEFERLHKVLTGVEFEG